MIGCISLFVVFSFLRSVRQNFFAFTKSFVFFSLLVMGFPLMSSHLHAGYREHLQQRDFGGVAGGMGLVEEELRERIRRKDREMAEQLDRMEVR